MVLRNLKVFFPVLILAFVAQCWAQPGIPLTDGAGLDSVLTIHPEIVDSNKDCLSPNIWCVQITNKSEKPISYFLLKVTIFDPSIREVTLTRDFILSQLAVGKVTPLNSFQHFGPLAVGESMHLEVPLGNETNLVRSSISASAQTVIFSDWSWLGNPATARQVIQDRQAGSAFIGYLLSHLENAPSKSAGMKILATERNRIDIARNRERKSGEISTLDGAETMPVPGPYGELVLNSVRADLSRSLVDENSAIPSFLLQHLRDSQTVLSKPKF